MENTHRSDGRAADGLRPTTIEIGLQPYAEGSALITTGRTSVLCAVSVSDRVPGWLAGRGSGWLTAQYSMLPRATSTRNPRPGYDGKVKGRSQEIQRLIGRSLRAGLDMELLGEQLLTVDCDVVVADGGTRCASITGAWVALRLAIDKLMAAGAVKRDPLAGQVAAVSCGLVDCRELLDLAADEDQRAEADFNFVFTGPGRLAEIQATAEKGFFDWGQAQRLHELAEAGTAELFEVQRRTVAESGK